MKNFIINIFKTLIFFDVSVIILSLFPTVKKSNPAISALINEAIPLGLILIFTLIFVLAVEKKQIKVPFVKRPFKSLLIGLGTGAVIPIVIVALLAILKHFNYIGFNKTSNCHYWLLALLCSSVATELFLRGYLFVLYKKFYGFTFSAVVTTMLYLSLNFEIFSKDKIFIANIVLFNILLCFLLEYSNSVVTTITARFVYTAISTLLLGSYPLTQGYPILLNHTFAEKKFFIGTEYPLENSPLMLSILSFVTLIFIFNKYRPVKNIKAFIKSIPQRKRANRYRKSMQTKKAYTKR